LFWGLAGIAMSATVPVADAATMRMTRRRGTDYGTIRGWATVGFLVMILITGYSVNRWGGWLFLPLFCGLALLRGASSLILPNFRAEPGEAVAGAAAAAKLLSVMKPWFLLPLLGWAMIFSTHLVLNAFQGLLWKQAGLPLDVIGWLIGLGAFSEAAMMFVYRWFSGRFSARHMIILSAVVSALRWLAMAYSPSVPVLFALQSLHGVTFAIGFMASINFVANWTGEEIAAEAQSFLFMLQQGCGVAVIVAFGWLVPQFGMMSYLASALIAALGGVLVWLSLRMRDPAAQNG
jgi:PPP family 3-phenylpropionic acid transporter